MAKINILSDTLTDKIAAGEVVERPASVVKELVENSLDAGSARITVEIENGGKKLIKVTDDGEGMDKKDAHISIERHATSKIKQFSDLTNISSFGFRGEALPSIASVCIMRLTTKPHNEIEGTEIYIEGEKIKSIKPSGAAAGTAIEIKNLFFNTPARKKFLKSTQTEYINIYNYIIKASIANFQTAFKFVKDGKEVFNFHKNFGLKDRLTHFFNEDIKNFYEINYDGEEVKIKGYVLPYDKTFSTWQNLLTFVNNRPLNDKLVRYAVLEAYGDFIPKRRIPAGFINVSVPSHFVDFNVHPQKLEVRFKDPYKLKKQIALAVKNVLLKETKKTFLSAPEAAVKSSAMPGRHYYKTPSPPREGGDYLSRRFNQFQSAKLSSLKMSADELPQAPLFEQKYDFKVIGSVFYTHIIIEKNDEVWFVDYHAASERIRYEKYLKAKEIQKEELLLPHHFKLSAPLSKKLLKYLNVFRELGITIEEFGENSFVIKTLPVIYGKRAADKKEIISAVEEFIGENFKSGIKDIKETVIKTIACKRSVKSGEKIMTEESYMLINELLKCDNPQFCPHGRPLIFKITKNDLNKKFLR